VQLNLAGENHGQNKESPFEKKDYQLKEYFIQLKIIDFVVGVRSIILVLSLWETAMRFSILLTKFGNERRGKEKSIPFFYDFFWRGRDIDTLSFSK